MLSPPIPENEASRAQAVLDADVLDTRPDPQFDDLVLLAATICHTPIAVINFITSDRQIIKARVGIKTESTSRDIAFCAHTIAQKDLLIVSDPLNDERFHDHPSVTGDPNIRFYAGMPVIDDKGHALGTVCVIDRVPRELSEKQKASLRILARHVLIHLEIRKSELKATINSIPRA